MTVFLVDNSIWQKAGRSKTIPDHLAEISTRHLIITCPPQVLEYCHSARNLQEYSLLRADMNAFLPAFEHPDEELVLNIQQSLWDAGFRAAVAIDCLMAAYAVQNEAVVLNSDADFSYIERATKGLVRQEYIPA